MKKTFTKVIAVLLVVLTVFQFSVFALPTEEDFPLEGEAITGIQTTLNENFQKVLENNGYELYFSKQTAEISVVCKENGYVWYSNPQSNGEIRNSAKENSQIVIYYYENRDLTSINSFEGCINLEDKLSWDANDNSFTVIYNIGDDSFTSDALPTVLSKERMENDILSKLNDEDKETVLDRFSLYAKSELDEGALKTIKLNFPSIEKHDLYIRSKMPDYIAEEIYEIFKKAGYTAEDLQHDCDDNGIENTYKEKPSFYIELEYTLSKTGLKARIDTSKITYNETYKPCRIEVLPYFGASVGETGYMIVPDGCGAVIEFDNGKYNTNPYWKKFFNEDNSLTKEETNANAQVSVLPVFAVSKENNGVLATIDSAYEVAGVSADVAGGNNNYNYIHSFFDIFSSDSISLSKNEQDKFILSNDKIISSPIEISYHFISGQHTYTDFALKYRELLIENGILSEKKKSGSPIGFEFLGTVQVTKRFLGVPYKTMTALTNYNQAGELIGEFGIDNATVTFADALKGGKVQNSADNLKLQSILGSKKALKKLKENAKVSVSYYGQYAYKIKKKDAAITLGKSKAKLYGYDFISRYVDSKNALNVISATKLDNYADKIVKSIKSNGFDAVKLLDLGYQLNSDFNSKNSIDRCGARISTQNYLSKISENSSVLLSVGSIFSLQYADMIKEIPVSSSGYHIEDYSIPFYEIAISGYIPYAVSSLNTATDSRIQFLKAVEFGGQLQYTWIYNLPDNITDNGTEYYKYLYSNSYSTAKKTYQEYAKLYEKINGQSISNHQRITDTLMKTTFENGLMVYVNYSETSVEIDGITIEANDFTYIE